MPSIRHVLDRIAGVIRPGPIDSHVCPDEPRHDDVYVASFPRSGNTWMTFLLANVQIAHLGLAEEVNFFNSRRYVPDLHQSTAVPPSLSYAPFPRFLKTHSRHVRTYNKAILVVRDPRPTMLSFWRFSRALYGYRRDLAGFVRDPRYGIEAWARHTNSWVRDKPPGVRLHIVRYEDLQQDPFGELRRIIEKIGIAVSDDTLRTAIERSSSGRMREIEERTNSDLLDPRGYRFVHGGDGSEADASLSAGDLKYVASVAAEPMRYFAYE